MENRIRPKPNPVHDSLAVLLARLRITGVVRPTVVAAGAGPSVGPALLDVVAGAATRSVVVV